MFSTASPALQAVIIQVISFIWKVIKIEEKGGISQVEVMMHYRTRRS